MKSQFLKYIKDVLPILPMKLIINGHTKRNNINSEDIKKSEIVGFSPCDETDKMYFLPFDFDCKGVDGLGEQEAINKALSLLDIIQASPAVLQKSKSGKGVHLLVKCVPFTADVEFRTLFKKMAEFFCFDFHPMQKKGCIDLMVKDPDNENCFKVIKEVSDEKPFEFNDLTKERLRNAVQRERGIAQVNKSLIKKIEELANLPKDSERNTKLNAYVYSAFQLFHYGLNENIIYEKFKDACERNGYIEEEGINHFNQVFESAKKAGKANPSSAIVDVNIDGSDLIVDLETQTEISMVSNALKLLPSNIFYVVDSNQFYDQNHDIFMPTLESACAHAGIRIFSKDGKDKLKRLKSNQSLVQRAFNKIDMKMFDFKRKIKRFVTRPCVVGDRIIRESGFYDGGVLAKIHEPSQKVTIEEVLDGYVFASTRSKAYVIAGFFAAVTAMRFNHRKPGFYYHAYSQAGGNSGKTTLAEITCYARCDKKGDANFSDDKSWDEVRKKITSGLLGGARAILMDNLPSHKNYLKFPELDAWFTAENYSDRFFHTQSNFSTQNDILWLLTGNQIELSDDLKNRIATIVFSGKYPSYRKKDINTAEMGNNVAWAMMPMVEKWLLYSNSPTILSSEDSSAISCYIKFRSFWDSFHSFCMANNIDFGSLSELELEESRGDIIEYDDLLEALAEKEGTAKELYEENREAVHNYLGYRGCTRKLGRILMDLCQRQDKRVVILENKSNGNYYKIMLERPKNRELDRKDLN